MQHGKASTGAFTLLHGDHLRFQTFTRQSEAVVDFALPYAGTVQQHCVSYSRREIRPLIVLDGEVPENGLPKQARQLCAVRLDEFVPHQATQRKRRKHELPLKRPWVLTRRYLVLPQGKGLVIRYRNISGAYKYVVLDVMHHEEDWWRLTTNTMTY